MHLNASQQSPLPPVKAWIAVAKCVATTAGLLARRQIHQPRTYVDERLHFADGTSRLLSAFAIAGLKVLLARGFGWRVVH
jgi:hypothetical protein